MINYFQADPQLYDFHNSDLLPALTQLWQHRGVRRTLILNHWVGLGEDVSQYFIRSLSFHCAPDENFRIMTNIEDLLDPNYILSDEEVLRARVQTFGAFKLSFGIKDFQYNFLDVGGVRFERCKWKYHYSQVNHIIFVISLPGYYQYLVEDGKTVSFFRANYVC